MPFTALIDAGYLLTGALKKLGRSIIIRLCEPRRVLCRVDAALFRVRFRCESERELAATSSSDTRRTHVRKAVEC
jgi:hypothetical protein